MPLKPDLGGFGTSPSPHSAHQNAWLTTIHDSGQDESVRSELAPWFLQDSILVVMLAVAIGIDIGGCIGQRRRDSLRAREGSPAFVTHTLAATSKIFHFWHSTCPPLALSICIVESSSCSIHTATWYPNTHSIPLHSALPPIPIPRKDQRSAMPRYQKPVKPRHDPLHVELEADSSIQKFGRVSKPGRRRARDGAEGEDEGEGVSEASFAPRRGIEAEKADTNTYTDWGRRRRADEQENPRSRP